MKCDECNGTGYVAIAPGIRGIRKCSMYNGIGEIPITSQQNELCDGFAFKDELEYAAWLHTYKAVEFGGFWENQTVVFSYRPAHHLLTKDEWDAIKLPTDTRLMNGSILLVKYEYDDENHVLHEYRYGNSGELDWRTNKPYRVAYHELEGKQTIREIHKRTAE